MHLLCRDGRYWLTYDLVRVQIDFPEVFSL
jgi:hypothetical protein